MRITGCAISPGLAVGTAFVYQDPLHYAEERRQIDDGSLDTELQRIERGIEAAIEELAQTSSEVRERLDDGHAAIFEFQAAVLRDPELREELRREVVEGHANAEHVVRNVFRRWERRLQDMDDPVIQQRREDMRDISRRVIEKLKGVLSHALEMVPENRIIVAKRLLPSDTVVLSRKKTVAVAVERGGPASHAALITREMGIPAVSGLAGLLEAVKTGDELVVDGSRGIVEINPDATARAEAVRRVQAYYDGLVAAQENKGEEAWTRDGERVVVLGNIGNRDDCYLAAQYGAEGIGLFRTEQFYLAARKLPSVDEIAEAMLDAVTPLNGKPVTIRLVDIGGDKELPYIDFGEVERDPFLGRRGVRLLLAYPNLLRDQLKALLRLSRDIDLRVMIPMVTFADEIASVRGLMEEVAGEIGVDRLPPLGAMVETPSAALCIGELAAQADFLSVGTNDLTQYTLAVGRENAMVSSYFRDDHPAVFRLLEMIVAEAGDCPLSICGELAGRIEAVERLVQLGYRTLSVAPPLVAAVKLAVRQATARPQE